MNTEKNSTPDNPERDLFCKIVQGDKSDNIPSVFKKCGLKTAQKMYDEPETFRARLEKDGVQDVYERNRTLVDFNRIPQELVDDFKTNCLRLG